MPKHRRRFLAAFSLLLACLATAVIGLGSAGAAGGEPAEDHLVVTDIGVTSGEVARAVDIERFSGTGVSDGQDWFLPTVTSGSNHAFTLQGSSNAVGALALSADKRFVTLAGYTTAVGGATNTAEPRDVARVNAVGGADTSTTLGLTFEKEKIRGAVTNDGTGFWVTGNGNGETSKPLGGMVYAPLGNSTTPTVIFSKRSPDDLLQQSLEQHPVGADRRWQPLDRQRKGNRRDLQSGRPADDGHRADRPDRLHRRNRPALPGAAGIGPRLRHGQSDVHRQREQRHLQVRARRERLGRKG